CHGEDGRGNGPITNTMRNEWGFQFRARNFTRGGLFKRGNAVRDIFITVSTGLNGTPMGSFIDLLTEEERWHLAHFVNSLNRENAPVTIVGGSIMVQSALIEGDLPTDPNDTIWTDIAIPTEIAIGPQLMVVPRQWVPSLLSITVRSVFNKTDIAFLLEWDDRTGVQDETYCDAVALQFPSKLKDGIQKPHFAMGVTGGSVNIWHWKAAQDIEAQRVGFQNIKEVNGGSSFSEMNAKGFKTRPSVQPIESQAVRGNSVWRNGQWKVVMIRSLITGDKKDIQFEKNKNIPIAFASWDGANNDLGGRHNLAPWYYLILLTAGSNDIYVYIALAVIMAVGGELWFVARIRRRLKPEKKFLNFNFTKEGHS
ncbi:MAG: ethylbenzene dehydrogenase-related protein, partial [Candidatus Anammoxibacter sp.]